MSYHVDRQALEVDLSIYLHNSPLPTTLWKKYRAGVLHNFLDGDQSRITSDCGWYTYLSYHIYIDNQPLFTANPGILVWSMSHLCKVLIPHNQARCPSNWGSQYRANESRHRWIVGRSGPFFRYLDPRGIRHSLQHGNRHSIHRQRRVRLTTIIPKALRRTTRQQYLVDTVQRFTSLSITPS